jgi:hypothetical protein
MLSTRNLQFARTPVQYDASGAGSNSVSGVNITESHTINARADCVVSGAASFAGEPSATGYVGTTSMTAAAGTQYDDATQSYGGCALFYLKAPPTGSQTIKTTFGSSPSYALLSSVSFFNVGNVLKCTPLDGFSTAPNIDCLATPPGSILVMAVTYYEIGSVTVSSYAGWTQIYNNYVGTRFGLWLGYMPISVNTSTDEGITLSTASYWATQGVVLQPVC